MIIRSIIIIILLFLSKTAIANEDVYIVKCKPNSIYSPWSDIESDFINFYKSNGKIPNDFELKSRAEKSFHCQS